MDIAIREGYAHKIVDERDDSIAVMAPFDFATPPHKRELLLWWDKEHCIIFRDCQEV